jgi:hypothetical protein
MMFHQHSTEKVEDLLVFSAKELVKEPSRHTSLATPAKAGAYFAAARTLRDW